MFVKSADLTHTANIPGDSLLSVVCCMKAPASSLSHWGSFLFHACHRKPFALVAQT